jgi:hypothetical protein
MTGTTPFLEELLVLKKQQAMELFGPWDLNDEGRIAVKHVRPLLLSVFPEASNAPPYLTFGRVKTAYEDVTHRPYHAPASMATASSSTHHARRPRDPMYIGPTLDELHSIIDSLASSEKEPAGAETAAAARTAANGRFSATQTSTEPRTLMSSNSPAGARFRLLQGSIEQIYRMFCAACTASDEPVPAVLPVDGPHLKRLAWSVRSRRLQLGESYALHRLFATVADPDVDDSVPEESAVRSISRDTFVNLFHSL